MRSKNMLKKVEKVDERVCAEKLKGGGGGINKRLDLLSKNYQIAKYR